MRKFVCLFGGIIIFSFCQNQDKKSIYGTYDCRLKYNYTENNNNGTIEVKEINDTSLTLTIRDKIDTFDIDCKYKLSDKKYFLNIIPKYVTSEDSLFTEEYGYEKSYLYDGVIYPKEGSIYFSIKIYGQYLQPMQGFISERIFNGKKL